MIVRLFNRFGAALITALLFIAFSGCASSPKQAAANSPKIPSKTKLAEQGNDAFPEISEQALQSYAHYATGLSLDMRDDSTAALDEYIQAANANPAEEPLV